MIRAVKALKQGHEPEGSAPEADGSATAGWGGSDPEAPSLWLEPRALGQMEEPGSLSPSLAPPSNPGQVTLPGSIIFSIPKKS